MKNFELDDLHEKLLNRKCYTMADVIKGAADAGTDGKYSSQDIMDKFKSSPFYTAFLNTPKMHTKGQDATAAINELSSVVLDAAAPDAIGRSLVRIIETTKESIKVRLPVRGKARKGARGASGTSKGQRETFVTLTPNKEFEAREEWDRTYLEDADWDVAAEEAAELSRSLKELESATIIAQIEGIAAASLAGGAVVSAATAGTLAYADLVNLWKQIKKENFQPNAVMINPEQAGDLFKDSDFKNSTILGEFVDIANGRFGRTILGVDILVSSLVTDTDVQMLDTNLGVMYAIRRDSQMLNYDKPPDTSGMQITTRYDLQNGRTKAISRIIDA